MMTAGLILAGTTLAGCETMQGAGRDMHTAGQLLSEQAANSQSQMAPGPVVQDPMMQGSAGQTVPGQGGYVPPAVTPAPY